MAPGCRARYPSVHQRRVLAADIATRNFLLDEDLSLQMCNFTESVIVTNDQDMVNFVAEDFVSVKYDIARFGSMMYGVISNSRYEFYVVPEIEADLDDDPESNTFKAWPAVEKPPNTDDVFLGDIIRGAGLGTGSSRCRRFVAPWILLIKRSGLKVSGDAKTYNHWRHLLRLESLVANKGSVRCNHGDMFTE